jgi:hypothetical protein
LATNPELFLPSDPTVDLEEEKWKRHEEKHGEL